MNIKDKLRRVLLFEDVETTNTAKKGDYIVKNPTGEEYVLTPAKFEKNYMSKPLGDEDSKGYNEYKNNVESRNVVEISDSISDELTNEFTNNVPSQADFLKFMKRYETRKAEKSVIVKARVATKEEKVITKTKKESDSDIIIKFMAPWDETMILKKGDFIVVMKDEVYRIGKYEFNNTYKLR
jgi:hypothetical protein